MVDPRRRAGGEEGTLRELPQAGAQYHRRRACGEGARHVGEHRRRRLLPPAHAVHRVDANHSGEAQRRPRAAAQQEGERHLRETGRNRIVLCPFFSKKIYFCLPVGKEGGVGPCRRGCGRRRRAWQGPRARTAAAREGGRRAASPPSRRQRGSRRWNLVRRACTAAEEG